MKSLQKRKITNSEYHFGKSMSAFKCAALFSTMLSCSQTEVPQEPSNGVLLEQYSGKITRDLLDDGTYSDPYQANRYYVKYKNPTTKEGASSFANSLSNTKIVGYMLPLNIFVYETSEDNRDASIEYFSNKQEVVDYAARVYYLYKKSSPQWDNEILANSGSDLEKKGLWGVQKTELSAGLNLLDRIALKPTTIAILEWVGFSDITDSKSDIPYVKDENVLEIGNLYWNFGYNNNDLNDVDPHGMNVSRLAAARNDGAGVNGVASNKNGSMFKIFPIRFAATGLVFEDQTKENDKINFEAGDQMQAAAALVHISNFVDYLNIRVVNMSFHYEHLLKNNFCKATGGVTEALGRLNEKGVILVAGAANDNKESCNVLPASLPNVISVGATRCDFGLFGSTCKEKRGYKEELLHERVKWASNYSKDEKCLTLAAPGQDLLTYPNGTPFLDDGTSYASPQVAGLAALITAVKPDTTYDYVKRLMRENADPILLDDDPEPTIRDLIFYRINVRRTIEALLREQMGAKIPSNCKSFNSTDSSPNNVLRFADAYASTAVFANYPDGFIYDFEKGELTKIPRDSAKYSDLSDFSIWDKDILFHCTLKSGEKRTCKYSIDQLNFEEFAFKSISQGGYGLDLNYWNGNVTYFPIDADPFQLFSHDYRSMRPSKGIDVPGLSLLRPSLPILDQFSPTTLIYDPSVLGRKLYLYDQKDGLKEIPISDPIYSYSMTNSGIALFSAGKSVFNVSPIYKLDTTTRNLSTVPVPLNEIDFGKDPIDSRFIPLFNGQFATYSAQSKKTVYVWNVNTGAKDLEVTIADNEKLGYPRPVALKGGTLTLSVEISSGTRTYSCPIK